MAGEPAGGESLVGSNGSRFDPQSASWVVVVVVGVEDERFVVSFATCG